MTGIFVLGSKGFTMSLNVFMKMVNKNILVYPCEDSDDAMACLNSHSFSLFIVDIEQMSKERSNQLLSKIRKHPDYGLSWLIIIGNSKTDPLYYYQTFHCYEYIAKPFQDTYINKTILKLLEYKLKKDSSITRKHFSYVKSGKQYKIILDQITFAEIYYKNCTVHTKKKSYEIGRMPLSQLEEKLPGHFVKCHRSYIINEKHFKQIISDEDGLCIELKECDYPIPIGRMYKTEILNRFSNR